jgi:hypothetical protein
MPIKSQDADFHDALANAEILYRRYLDTARLADLGDVACTWHEDFQWMPPGHELLELSQPS